MPYDNYQPNPPTPSVELKKSEHPDLRPFPSLRDPRFLSDARWGKVEFVVKLKRPLHVGSEELKVQGRQVVKVMCRGAGGAPCVPGTSWKGVFRSLSEVLSPSYLLDDVASNRPIPEEQGCWAMRIFGALRRSSAFKGRISFCDSVFSVENSKVHNLINSYQPHQQKDGLKYYKQPSDEEFARSDTDKKIPVECVDVGKPCMMTLRIDGLYDSEVGLLLLTSGALPKNCFDLQVGYGRSQGMGKISLSLNSLLLRRGRAPLGEITKWSRKDSGDDFSKVEFFYDKYKNSILSYRSDEWKRIEGNIEKLKSLK